jgi:hypothetical protein
VFRVRTESCHADIVQHHLARRENLRYCRTTALFRIVAFTSHSSRQQQQCVHSSDQCKGSDARQPAPQCSGHASVTRTACRNTCTTIICASRAFDRPHTQLTPSPVPVVVSCRWRWLRAQQLVAACLCTNSFCKATVTMMRRAQSSQVGHASHAGCESLCVALNLDLPFFLVDSLTCAPPPPRPQRPTLN